MKSRGITFKLVFFILTSTMIVSLVAFVYDYQASKGPILRVAQETARNLTFATINEIETITRGIEKVVQHLTYHLEEDEPSRDQLAKILRMTVVKNPEIFGSASAYEPFAFDPSDYCFSPYAYRRPSGDIGLIFLGGETYPYFFMDWYQLPKLLARPLWSEPYFDEGGGNVMMATLSIPFFKTHEGRRVFRGVATADIALQWLRDKVSAIRIYETGYAFLLSRNGVFITHPHSEFVMRESIFSLAEARGDQQMREIGRSMIRGEEGFVKLHQAVTGKEAWLYYASLPSSGWSLGVIFPDEELYGDAYRLAVQVILIDSAGFLILSLVITLIARTITKPLRVLAHTTTEIAKGNLDVPLPEHRAKDEIGLLNRSFIEMKSALKHYIANLAETTAAKERIESELKIAHNIQMNFLPKRFPPFPDCPSFEIYADLEPAREVSGDLYDYFLLDEKHLFFTVADVSGKGIPAALFMAVTKTLLKGIALSGTELPEIFRRVNLELCQDNQEVMFVSAFSGVLDIETGELTYTNAGHLPPIMASRGGGTSWLTLPDGLFLGIFDHSEYQVRKTTLLPGDVLLAYTDGVTEAMNQQGVLYSGERLLQLVESLPIDSSRRLVDEIIQSVREYTAGPVPSDDVTVLAILFKGPST